eukprot:SAG31_NODE_101_length_25195_cov_67.436758_5_plen_66_part_00
MITLAKVCMCLPKAANSIKGTREIVNSQYGFCVEDGWTKDETDHLFELCERFELKWVVIHDRYQV